MQVIGVMVIFSEFLNTSVLILQIEGNEPTYSQQFTA